MSNRVKVADPVVSAVGGVLALVAKFINWFSFFFFCFLFVFLVFLESRNFFNILNWTYILQWNVFGAHSDGQSPLLNSFVRVKSLSMSKLVMCKGVQTKKSGWCRVRVVTALYFFVIFTRSLNRRIKDGIARKLDASAKWCSRLFLLANPTSTYPACFACASLGFAFACTLLVFSFACANSERLWTVSCGVCMFLRRVKNSWIRPCCNPWKLLWQVAGAPNGSFR